MVKTIKDIGTDDTDTPASSKIIMTQESNLDIVEFEGTRNLDLNNLDEFEFKDFNNVTIFTGVARKDNTGDTTTVFGFDYGQSLGEIRIRKNWENKTPLEIMQDVVDNYTSLTFSNPTSITSTKNIIIYPSPNKPAIKIINEMHTLLGSTHYVDTNKNFILEFEGQELNSNILEVGVNCNTVADGWERDTDMLVTNLTVNGDIKETEEIEFKDGTGSQTTYSLANPNVEIRVEHPVGTILKPEIKDLFAGDYTFNKETSEIEFKVAPAAGTDNIKIYYVYQIQTNFIIPTVSQTETVAGTNPHEKEINVKFLKEVADCRDYALKYRDKFKNPLRSARLLISDIDLTNYRANQRIRVKDSIHLLDGSAINEEFIIKRIERTFGNGAFTIELTVGDSTEFVYDRETEIDQRIDDLNQSNPTATIFNEAIEVQNENILGVSFESEEVLPVNLKVATLPSNILVYSANRKYSVNTDTSAGYKFIGGSDFISLFQDVE